MRAGQILSLVLQRLLCYSKFVQLFVVHLCDVRRRSTPKFKTKDAPPPRVMGNKVKVKVDQGANNSDQQNILIN
jgi:hypothetical protein